MGAIMSFKRIWRSCGGFHFLFFLGLKKPQPPLSHSPHFQGCCLLDLRDIVSRSPLKCHHYLFLINSFPIFFGETISPPPPTPLIFFSASVETSHFSPIVFFIFAWLLLLPLKSITIIINIFTSSSLLMSTLLLLLFSFNLSWLQLLCSARLSVVAVV